MSHTVVSFPTPGQRLREHAEAEVRAGLGGLHPPEVIEWVVSDLGRRYPWEPLRHEPVSVPKGLEGHAMALMDALDQRQAERNLAVFLVLVGLEIELYYATQRHSDPHV